MGVSLNNIIIGASVTMTLSNSWRNSILLITVLKTKKIKLHYYPTWLFKNIPIKKVKKPRTYYFIFCIFYEKYLNMLWTKC